MPRQFSRFVLRSTSQCFGEFSPPRNPDKALEKLMHNLDYYKANYLLSLAIGLCIVGILRPIAIAIIALTIASIWYLLFEHQWPVIILGKRLSRREIFFSCLGAGYLGLCLLGGRAFWYTFAIWLIACLAHALLRKETFGAKINNMVNRVSKPSKLEDAFFGLLEEMFGIQGDGPEALASGLRRRTGLGRESGESSTRNSSGSAEVEDAIVDPEDPDSVAYAAYRQTADENRSKRREIVSQLRAKYGSQI